MTDFSRHHGSHDTDRRTAYGRWRGTVVAVLAALAMAPMAPAVAIDRIVFEAGDASMNGGLAATALRAELRLGADGRARLVASAQRVVTGTAAGTLRSVAVECADTVIREPRLACSDGRLAAGGSPLGPLRLRAAASYRTDSGVLEFRASDLALAGGRVEASGTVRAAAWQLQGTARGIELEAARTLAAPWATLPDGFSAKGKLDLAVRAQSRGHRTTVALDGTAPATDFGNADGTVVGEKLAAGLRATLTVEGAATRFDARLSGTSGQALAGPVLFDFGANPLQLDARGTLRDGEVAFESAAIAQKDLLSASGSARLRWRPAVALDEARIEVQRLQFPAAYASFLQLALASGDFGALQTSGSAAATLEAANGAPVRAQLRLEGLGVEDAKGKFSLDEAHGEVNWSADGRTDVAPSWLAWRRGSAYGLSGSDARVDFRAVGRGLELLKPARLPVFDGAIVVDRLSLREAGRPDAEFDFEAVIEPISMPLVTRAFGWPELQGQLAGRVPGLEYRNRVLAVKGDVVARVFDGTIVGRNLRLQDPLGPWPRLFADVEARRLDLGLVTRAFPIGSITGRLDGDLRGLELFNWEPVAFDGRLYTSPGDRSRHRINQKAVTSLSSIGGGGGGVTAALQSGLLRFFDEFNYDRIGLSCRLRNEVCDMGGIPREGGGFYIVKGRGIPRIDVVGNSARVDWPQLVSQIVAGMGSEGVVVK